MKLEKYPRDVAQNYPTTMAHTHNVNTVYTAKDTLAKEVLLE